MSARRTIKFMDLGLYYNIVSIIGNITMGKLEEIVALLHQELAHGNYAAGDLFPSGYELANRYGVSQPAVNIAVSHLVLEGLLERGVRGAGTRVRATSQFPKGWIAAILSATHPLNAQILTAASARALESGYAVVHFPRP